MTTRPAPIFRFFILPDRAWFFNGAFAKGAAFLFCLLCFFSTVTRAQSDVVPLSKLDSEDPLDEESADTLSESVSQASAQQSTPDATHEQKGSFIKSDHTPDKPERSSQLVRYLAAGGLLLGGIVLAVPPIYYLAAGQGCTEYEGERCSKRILPMAWYDYAGLTLGGLMVGAGVAVLVWPTRSATGERATTLVLRGQF